MSHTNNRLWSHRISVCWILIGLFPLLLSGAEKDYTAAGETKHGADFVLIRQGDRFSLRAQQASLRDIVETLGSMLSIDVVARIPWDIKITLDFAGLSLEGALQRLRTFANIVYVKDTGPPAGKITRIIVIPIQGGDTVAQPTVRTGIEHTSPTSAQPEPFKFEFDPSKLMERKR
jgi:hypothetical protein